MSPVTLLQSRRVFSFDKMSARQGGVGFARRRPLLAAADRARAKAEWRPKWLTGSSARRRPRPPRHRSQLVQEHDAGTFCTGALAAKTRSREDDCEENLMNLLCVFLRDFALSRPISRVLTHLCPRSSASHPHPPSWIWPCHRTCSPPSTSSPRPRPGRRSCRYLPPPTAPHPSPFP